MEFEIGDFRVTFYDLLAGGFERSVISDEIGGDLGIVVGELCDGRLELLFGIIKIFIERRVEVFLIVELGLGGGQVVGEGVDLSRILMLAIGSLVTNHDEPCAEADTDSYQ